MNREDTIWLAGFLEGEGSFVVEHRRYQGKNLRIIVCAGSKDEDVIRKVCAIAGGNVWEHEYNEAPFFKWHLARRFEAVAVMEAVLPWMGGRRSAKIQEVLELHKTTPFGRRPKGTK